MIEHGDADLYFRDPPVEADIPQQAFFQDLLVGLQRSDGLVPLFEPSPF